MESGHGALNAARNTAGNLKLRGQSYSALGSNEYITFVATISCLNYNLRTTLLEEFVDKVMYSFTIVFVDRDVDKVGWEKIYRGKVTIACP